VPQRIGTRNSRLLRLCHVQRQAASDDQHRYRDHSSRFHGDLLHIPSRNLVISVPAEVI